MYKIYPKPKQITEYYGSFSLEQTIKVENNCFNNLDCELRSIFNDYVNEPGNVFFILNDKLEQEEYKLLVLENKIEIEASTSSGAYYALKTLKQLKSGTKILTASISDKPDLKIRGLMLDISRTKVIKLSELKKVVDLLSDLKYNHLELYVEGFSFEYKSFPHQLRFKNYISLQDYLAAEEYANAHFIDFVPNQNGFGHMMDWLNEEEFHHLAESPEGFTIWGSHRDATTLDPTNVESVSFVKKLYKDMLPHTKSRFFNMNFDEPYELGHGKSKDLCDKTSIEDVYIDYLKTLAEEVRAYGKTPMLWGDVLIKSYESIKKLDKDMIFIDWGYSKNYDFESHAKELRKLNTKFVFAPGTSSWSSIAGRYDDMYYSIKNSASAAKKYGGLGIIVTDWGDIGHLQYLPFSYMGIIFSGLIGWSDANEKDILEYLSSMLGEKLSYVITELSKFTRFEGTYRDYGSRLFASILWSEKGTLDRTVTDLPDYFLKMMKNNLVDETCANNLQKLFINCSKILVDINPSLEKDEVQNSLFLLNVLLVINTKITKYLKGEQADFTDEINLLDAYSVRHKILFEQRNNKFGYEFSVLRIKLLQKTLGLLNERRQNEKDKKIN